MAGFTPGPWEVDEDHRPGMSWNRHITDGGDNRICFMSHPGDQGSAAQSKANARLIAAAPELYAALDLLCRSMDDLDRAGLSEEYDIAQLALAKARGEQ